MLVKVRPVLKKSGCSGLIMGIKSKRASKINSRVVQDKEKDDLGNGNDETTTLAKSEGALRREVEADDK